MKRKADPPDGPDGPDSPKKRILPEHNVRRRFRDGLLDQRDHCRDKYAASEPYVVPNPKLTLTIQSFLHGVIHDLVDDQLLRRVRAEILDYLHFTEKETDIYKIHQSGDLANLDGLEDSSLSRLPSLKKLRDAMYSPTFRHFISGVASSGPLSGRKTDMAINVYTPRCHLLCHDDVIGSRRLSYILYLTDPDAPWRAEWGGALRLYPTETRAASDGSEAVVPLPQFEVAIPPAFNQLSFFTIQPGKSYHDVEEVYERPAGDSTEDGGRVRMAISGWFHIPQEGEDGFEPGLEEKLAERSSLSQLQSKADEFDRPAARWRTLDPPVGPDAPVWTEAELDWLLKYIHPGHLMPQQVEQLSETFRDASVVTIEEFLAPTFADKLRAFMAGWDAREGMPTRSGADDEDAGEARPPHKHRFMYRHAVATAPAEQSDEESPLDELLDRVLPSPLFARWLALFTGLRLARAGFSARRFRRGRDYELATGYDDESPQLELTLGITPTGGWGDEDGGDDDEDGDDEEATGSSAVSPMTTDAPPEGPKEDPNVGGYEVYMVGDDDDDDDDDEAEASGTGAGERKKRKADPAVYRAAGGDGDEDGGVLFSMPASWNELSIVLRDKGLLRFVKYVSAGAKGDRWDVVASYGVLDDDDQDDD
jgi:Rps23 Pro-64 3,4-dihydroxylase Tpa1-like proline 4-hydroxylase